MPSKLFFFARVFISFIGFGGKFLVLGLKSIGVLSPNSGIKLVVFFFGSDKLLSFFFFEARIYCAVFVLSLVFVTVTLGLGLVILG